MLFTDYQETYTDCLMDFAAEFDKLTDAWVTIVNGTSTEFEHDFFILTIGQIQDMWKKYPSDDHTDFLQTQIDDLYSTLNLSYSLNLEALELSKKKRADKIIEEMEFYVWNLFKEFN